MVPPKAFLQGLRDICDKHGILLIFDEVQTGGTFGGNPLACSAALETLAIIKEDQLLTKCKERGCHGTR